MAHSFLNKVHGIDSPEELQTYYDAWADTYEAEVLDNGYVTPARIARALAAQMQDLHQPIFDFGCGTGLSGAALIQAGFTTIDGADLSAEMIAHAREKGTYRDLWQIDAGEDLSFAPGTYAAITAIGVIGSGAAPLEVLDLLVAALAPNGLLGFSYNDKTLSDPAYEARLGELVDAGEVKLLFREYGPHLPKFNMNANVYIIEKA